MTNFVLEEQLREFGPAIPWASTLLRVLKVDDFKVTFARRAFPNQDSYWLLRIAPPAHVQEGFGLAPELQLVAVRGTTQARDIEQALKDVGESEGRLDLDCMIIADDAPDLTDRLSRLPIARKTQLQLIPWPAQEGLLLPLLNQLKRHMPAFDLFEERDPVRGRHVVGRKTKVRDLESRVERGDAVGVYGLRKMGKTSLVRAVTDQLDPPSARVSLPRGLSPLDPSTEGRPRVAAIWIDAQLMLSHTIAEFYDLLLGEIQRRTEAAGVESPITSTDPHPARRVQHILAALIDHLEMPVCLVVDEYDCLFEDGRVPNLDQLLAVFRGLSQTTGKFTLVAIGRDPTLLDRPKLSNVPNPLLQWFVPCWVGPLERDGANELLNKVGRRVGLKVGRRTREVALEWTGGHPLLHRQFGSALLATAQAQKSTSRPWPTDTEPLCKDAVTLFLERDAVQAIGGEVTALLSEKFPTSLELLRELSEWRIEDRAEVVDMFGGWTTPAARTLRNFGLLYGESTSPEMPRYIQWYLTHFGPVRRAADG